MIKKLYVFANMGHLDELPKSGGQSSARRVMKGLQENGFTIVPIRRHRAELEGRWKHQMEIMAFALIDLLKIITKIAFESRKDVAFLQLTYAGPLVPYELIITRVVRMMGYKSLIYLKGGQVLDYYKNGSERHRKMFKKVMDFQDKVFFEGMESLRIVERVSKTPLVYFPNYVFNDQIPTELPKRTFDSIGLLYFGRIAPNKNVDIILDAFEMLCKRYDNLYLTIIGGAGQSKSYTTMIDKRIDSSAYRGKITRLGITPFEEIMKIMQTQHFFIFPSKEKAEGHSNSLNEAMSQGLIPIVSDYHFNRSIVGDNRLVIEGFNAKDYAERIESILDNENLQTLSELMWKRVKRNFVDVKVFENILNQIKTI